MIKDGEFDQDRTLEHMKGDPGVDMAVVGVDMNAHEGKT
jgi:hypothetical protein